MTKEEALKSLYQLVYDATSASVPNLGGHHGFKGFESSYGLELLQTTAEFVRDSRKKVIDQQKISDYEGKCMVAQTLNIIDKYQLAKIQDLLGIIKQ